MFFFFKKINNDNQSRISHLNIFLSILYKKWIDYLYKDQYQNQIHTTSDGQIYVYYTSPIYVLYVLQLSTGETVNY